MNEQLFTIKTPEAMRDLGFQLANHLGERPALIFLYGDLGMGKTTFAQGFVAARCGQHTTVQSPTYAYVHTYPALMPVTHCDLYRINHSDEVTELGLRELLEDERTTRLIEWPEQLSEIMRGADITLHFAPQANATRNVAIKYFNGFPIIP